MIALLAVGLALIGAGAWVYAHYSREWRGESHLPAATARRIEAAAMILVCGGVAASLAATMWFMAVSP